MRGEYQEIRELAEKCPFAVTFAGKITQQELAKKMNQSDVFVLPSFLGRSSTCDH